MESIKDLKLQRTLSQVKGKLKQQYGDLTDNDLSYVEGKEEELVGRLQARLGMKKDEVIHMIKEKVEKL